MWVHCYVWCHVGRVHVVAMCVCLKRGVSGTLSGLSSLSVIGCIGKINGSCPWKWNLLNLLGKLHDGNQSNTNSRHPSDQSMLHFTWVICHHSRGTETLKQFIISTSQLNPALDRLVRRQTLELLLMYCEGAADWIHCTSHTQKDQQLELKLIVCRF